MRLQLRLKGKIMKTTREAELAEFLEKRLPTCRKLELLGRDLDGGWHFVETWERSLRELLPREVLLRVQHAAIEDAGPCPREEGMGRWTATFVLLVTTRAKDKSYRFVFEVVSEFADDGYDATLDPDAAAADIIHLTGVLGAPINVNIEGRGPRLPLSGTARSITIRGVDLRKP
jgi:hypothetical protein